MAIKKRKKRPTLDEISGKLDIILQEQKKLERQEEKVEELEKEELEKEEAIISGEKKELGELEKLEELERQVAEEVKPHPLTRITYKDLARGSVGALFGAVAHYTFIYGVKVAENITVGRATFLFLFSLFIGAIFLYATGFRKIKDPKILVFLPVRLITLYITAIVMSILVLLFFEPHFFEVFSESYKQVSTVTLTAIIGACTADLIGKE